MQNHYQVFCPSVETIVSDLARLPAGVEILVAEASTIVGFAAFSTIYPGPGLKSGIFLKELYVCAAFRGSGAGKRLMRAIAEVALQRGHKRIDWTADRENARLLNFYATLGALEQQEKVFYRLSGDALVSLAAPQKS
ncbi:GNAT family N-acetyltransferase [Phyllobacterium zundukense]|uniref:GNAT family N-acetyltransferase n=1 Tax=Phyllobacterium zundukense TaxID=1867719 RepID=A0A2N9W214_9HYPH|nr:GNAT family N-acetyltransferase [Phyllobacterium zundukense]PIO45782.1 GNAT family N-acetyltransferase [Phyllobacterium zundukense]